MRATARKCRDPHKERTMNSPRSRSSQSRRGSKAAPDPARRRRAAAIAAAVIITLCAVDRAAAQFGIGEAGILLRILTQNVEINAKLATNNKITRDYWNWHENDLAAGYRRVLPEIDRRVTRIFRDREIGYVEQELRRIEAMTREGRISQENRDDYELAFSKIPDTPDALAQLAVDENVVHLMTKAGQIQKKLDEYRREYERLAAEQQVSPHRADQIAKQQDLLRVKIDVCRAQMETITATNDAMQTAMANKFVKDEKAAQLEVASQLRLWCRSAKPPWMSDAAQVPVEQ